MTTTLVIWLSASVSWFDPTVTVGVGPAVYVSHDIRNVDTGVYTEDTLSIEPANISYELVDGDATLESRIDAYLTLPPSR